MRTSRVPALHTAASCQPGDILIPAFGGRLGDEAVGKLEIEIREFQVEVNRVNPQVEVNEPAGKPSGFPDAGLK